MSDINRFPNLPGVEQVRLWFDQQIGKNLVCVMFTDGSYSVKAVEPGSDGNVVKAAGRIVGAIASHHRYPAEPASYYHV